MNKKITHDFQLHGNKGFNKTYFIISGILLMLISFYFLLNFFYSSIWIIISIGSVFPGVYFVLIGIGLFSNPYKTYIKIDDFCLAYKFRPFSGVKRIPWSHLRDITIKPTSIIFTFLNYGKKEIFINRLNVKDLDSLKKVINDYWETKKSQKL